MLLHLLLLSKVLEIFINVVKSTVDSLYFHSLYFLIQSRLIVFHVKICRRVTTVKVP